MQYFIEIISEIDLRSSNHSVTTVSESIVIIVQCYRGDRTTDIEETLADYNFGEIRIQMVKNITNRNLKGIRLLEGRLNTS